MQLLKSPEPLPFGFLNLKFIYSEKATKFCEISIYVIPVKYKVEISQNFVAFSEYMNFKELYSWKQVLFQTER